MAIELNSLCEVVEKNYSQYYNIHKEGIPAGIPLLFRGTYYGKGQKSIFKKVGYENIEHLYCFAQRRFDETAARRCIEYSIQDATKRIKPDEKLSSANINVIFISNGFTADAVKAVKESKYLKKYEEAFFAKTELIACAADANLEKAWCNSRGYDMAAYFKSVFRAQHR